MSSALELDEYLEYIKPVVGAEHVRRLRELIETYGKRRYQEGFEAGEEHESTYWTKGAL